MVMKMKIIMIQNSNNSNTSNTSNVITVILAMTIALKVWVTITVVKVVIEVMSLPTEAFLKLAFYSYE